MTDTKEDSEGSIDTLSIGMIYAGGGGTMLGASIAHLTDFATGVVLGSLGIVLGLIYDGYQRYIHMETEQGETA